MLISSDKNPGIPLVAIFFQMAGELLKSRGVTFKLDKGTTDQFGRAQVLVGDNEVGRVKVDDRIGSVVFETNTLLKIADLDSKNPVRSIIAIIDEPVLKRLEQS